MQAKATNQLFKGAFILTLAALFGKVLSAAYRVPLQNMIGDMGYYIYQQIYPIIGIAFMLALYGFPAAISRFIAAEKNQYFTKMIIRKIFILLLLFHLALFVFFFLGSPYLAKIMGDPLLITPIRHSGWVFLFVPFVALLRGMFQGNLLMGPTAASQVSEQLVRVIVIILAAYMIYQSNLSLYKIGDGAVIAAVGGLSAAFFCLLLSYKKLTFQKTEKEPVRYLFILKHVIGFGILISMNHMLLLFLQLADAFTMVPRLLIAGYSPMESMEMKGILDRGQPLIQFATVLGSSLALTLIPRIAKQKDDSRNESVSSYVEASLKFSIYISVGATVGLIWLFRDVNQLLFLNDDGTTSLQVLALTILFTSLALTTAAVLQGLGYMKQTALFIFIGLVTKVILNYVLIASFGMIGAASATVLSVGIVAFFNCWLLRKVLKRRKLFSFSRGPLYVAAASMLLFLAGYEFIFGDPFDTVSRGYLALYVMGAVAIGAILYFIVLIVAKGFTKEELESMKIPKILLRNK